jgi:hypothetical protein
MAMETDAQNPWRFAQCFGDKGDVEDITEGKQKLPLSSRPLEVVHLLISYSGYHLDSRV